MDSLADARALERSRYCEIWRAIQSQKRLTGEAATIGGVLRDHPEYQEAWDRDDPPREEDYTITGINPFLHVSSHVAVENQLSAGKPPEVRETLQRLEQNGMTAHEAIHRIGAILMEEVHKAIKSRKPLNLFRYRRKIRKLA